MNLFATTDLRQRLGARPATCEQLDPADARVAWYGHLQRIGRAWTIVLLHADTRFTVVLDARGIADAATLQRKWREALPMVVQANGIAPRYAAAITIDSPVSVGKASDRRVMGTMNEWFQLIRAHRDVDRVSDSVELSRRLNATPIIGGDHGFPEERLVEFVDRLTKDDPLAPDRPAAARPSAPTDAPTRKRGRHASHLGRWRIIDMPYFIDGVLDLVAPAGIEFRRDGGGSMHFVALEAELAARSVPHGGGVRVTWSWSGFDDGTSVDGRGEAIVRGDRMHGRIVIDGGDAMKFEAVRVRSLDH